MKLVALLATLAAFALVAFAAPTKPVWPQQFHAVFGLNDGLAFLHNETANFYYNWPLEVQRIQYLTHCFPLAHFDSALYPCDLYFNNQQGIVLAMPAGGVDCCTFVSGVGAVPVQFLAAFNYSGVQSAADYFGNEQSCNYWTGPGDFAYWTLASGSNQGADIKFQDGPTGVTWAWNPNFNVAPQPASLFTLPTDGNCSAPCSFFFEGLDETMHKVQDPMVRLAMRLADLV